MADLLSPGVSIQEIDASTIVPSIAATTAVFCGNFERGPVDQYGFIDSVANLKLIYGNPNKENFNEWYQCYNFLQYGNKLYIGRACDLNGTLHETAQVFVSKDSKLKDKHIKYDVVYVSADDKTVTFTKTGDNIIKEGDEVYIKDSPTKYTANKVEDNGEYKVTFNAALSNPEVSSVFEKRIPATKFPKNSKLASFKGLNKFKEGDIFAFSDEISDKQYKILTLETQQVEADLFTVITYVNTEDNDFVIPDTVLADTKVYVLKRSQNSTAEVPGSSDDTAYDIEKYDTLEHTVRNFSVFEFEQQSLGFVNPGSKFKIFARSPGLWGESLEVAVANQADFGKNKTVINGISLDDLFEYVPLPNQIALMIFYKNELVETFITSFDEKAVDSNNKSIYIENLINAKSNFIFVNENKSCQDKLPKTCLGDQIIKLVKGSESKPGKDDITAAYDLFENKEEIDVDIIIANENYTTAAINLAEKRQDCVTIIGCPYEASVGLKASIATQKNVDYRRELNVNSSYCMLVSNYKYQYLPELDSYKWVNFAGDIAGLIAQTTETREAWYAPAGQFLGSAA